MDSLHVSGGGGVGVGPPTSGSKASSRSASPCRHRGREASLGDTPGNPNPPPFHPHHQKTLSHGSVESTKSQDGGGAHRPSRHRSPTASSGRQGAEPDDATPLPLSLDESAAGAGELDSSHQRVDWSFASDGTDEREGLDQKTSAVVEQLGNKIVRVRDLIRTEQKLRDDNVNEYLKLAANADKQQVQRIKAVFEKKNQKSAQVISQLQKKLDVYQKRVHELETHGMIQSHRPPREVLRDMGQGLKNVGGNIRDGITGFSGSVMSKPREFAHLIKNKFGSADNISQLSTWYVGPGAEGAAADAAGGGSEPGEKGTGRGHHPHHHGSATLPATLHATASQGSMQQHKQKFPSDEGSECSSVTSISIERYGRSQDTAQENFNEVNKKLRGIQEQLESFGEGFESVKQLQTEIRYLGVALQEEKFRTERLEEQINDLTELHQNEVENLKQAMADMEEKVQYQSEERLRDIHEMLEHCQTKIQKMEHQALQQQQYVTLEGLDNSNARALVVKLINVLLTVLQVILLLVATGAGIIMPFLRTRVRIITTLVFVVAVVFTLKQWPEVSDIGSHVMKRLKDTLDPVQ